MAPTSEALLPLAVNDKVVVAAFQVMLFRLEMVTVPSVNGVDDAYGITKTTNYYYTIYWPGYYTTSSPAYDLFAPIALRNDSLKLFVGYAYRDPPSVSSDGRMTFAYLGYLGDYSQSTIADSTAYVKSRLLMSDTKGYYFVQTGSATYDMVGARDAKSWITWQFPQ